MVENASIHYVSYFDFLHTVVSGGGGWEHRESAELNRRIQRAKLPYNKIIHDFDFAFQPNLNEQCINETLTKRYIANGENRLFLGLPGVGKTHLVIAFALEALTKGYSVLFLTAADLVAECHKAEAKGAVSRLIKKWTRPDLIVLDEVWYFPSEEFSANIFFQVISKRYEHGAMMFIEWEEVFGDDVLATAIHDRFLDHSVTFNIKGYSYRLKEKKKAGIYPAAHRLISKSGEFYSGYNGEK